MGRIFVICSLLICVYGASDKELHRIDDRIVGGHVITINQAPFQAAYQVNGEQTCGSSIISNTFVLCAAHCSIHNTANQVTIRVGSNYRSSGGTVHQATQIINHAGYTTSPLTNNDISLIKVATPFVYSGSVRAISLASSVPAVGSSVTATGWGSTSEGGSVSNQLQQVQVNVVSQADCNKSYFNHITSTMLCAGTKQGGKDTCQQDSGGPLVSGNQQVGVVSFGLGCGRAGVPGVYASVPAYRAWIKQHAGV